MKEAFLATAIAALFLISIGANAGFAMKNNDWTKSGGMSSGSQTENAMDHDSNDGAGFGAHVSEMAQKSSKHGMDK